ncbi:MAG: mechanosensitive ion channel family protein [Oscillospiraceae bacterium]
MTEPMTPEIGDTITQEAEHVSGIFSAMLDFLKGIFPSLVFALLTFTCGILLTKALMKAIRKALGGKAIDRTASTFLQSLIQVALYVLVTIITLSVLKVPMTSIITVIGTMGLAIGLALQDSLSHVAGGFLLLFTKPLQVGDFISVNGISGTVERIEILHTRIRTPDGLTVFIPNGTLSSSTITNYTNPPERRLDLNFGISYDDDSEKAKKLILDIIKNHPHALPTPAPLVRIGELGDSAVILTVQVWTAHAHYYPLQYDLTELVKQSFDENGISFPYPQTDVHINHVK